MATLNRSSLILLACLCTLSLMTGCPALNNGDGADNNTMQANNIPGLNNTKTDPNGWKQTGLGCYSGVSYVALHFDGDVGYMGCGDSSEGEGMSMTTDRGKTWESIRKFGGVRVIDIKRGPNGTLYGSGKDKLDGNRAFIINDSNLEAVKLDPLFVPMTTSAFRKVDRAQNIAVTKDGQMFVDSMTGTSAAYKPAGTDEWEELESIGEESLSEGGGTGTYQITKVRTFNNRFYAVGSIITDPASIRLPSKLEGATYHFQTVQPLPNRAVELKDLHIWSETSMLAVGHNQSERYPVILLADGDPYDISNWTQIDVFDSGIEYKGGINRIAVQGDRVVAVGEKIPTSQGGFILISEDKGKTWKDITPQATSSGKIKRMWHVWMWADGSIFAAGEGEAWRLDK